MQILVTSFGTTDSLEKAVNSPFFGLPPQRLFSNSFTPDYETLLFCTSIIMDEEAYYFAIKKYSDDVFFRHSAELLKLMHEEGFIELQDLGRIITDNRDLLEAMVTNDLKILDTWIQPFRESLEIWRNYISGLDLSYPKFPFLPLYNLNAVHDGAAQRAAETFVDFRLQEGLRSSRKRKTKEFRDVIRKALAPYLSTVNSNLLLSNSLRVGFYDWADYRPFYSKKFMNIAISSTEIEQLATGAQKLFEFSFPEFIVEEPGQFIKLITDKRIDSLRQQVSNMVETLQPIDQEFALATLKSVLTVEQKANKYRKIISWATKPLDLIPWVGNILSISVDEAVGYFIERNLKQDYRWYYLLSETVRDSNETA